jgi:integrase
MRQQFVCGQIARLASDELDLDNRTWHIPAERAKNGRQHEVGQSDLAMEIINSLPRFVDGHYVFASTRDDAKPAAGFVYSKQKVIDHMVSAEHWRLHELRRTATKGMARLGIPPHVADKVLNHQSGTIAWVAAVYTRFQYREERRAALETWGGFVERLVYPDRAQANVVALHGS